MSHFSVLVIGNDIEKQLQPYHEFECTGFNDEFVQDIDITAECHERFATDTTTMLKAADGSLHSFYDENGNLRQEFSQPAPEKSTFGKGRRTQFVPEGYEEKEVPTFMVKPFTKWIEGYYGHQTVAHGQDPDLNGVHKFGYTRLDAEGYVAKVIRRTNPNYKWDWWVVGGRWSGFLALKGRTERANNALKADIDLEKMRDEEGKEAGEKWDAAQAALAAANAPTTWRTWEQCRDEDYKGDINTARSAYHNQPSIMALRSNESLRWMPADTFLQPRESVVKAARDSACSPYALVVDGEWVAKGEMGWFAMSNDHFTPEDWNRRVNEFIDALPDDTLLTIVDCHI